MSSIDQNLIIIPDESIIKKIFFIRGKKVMIDKDLSELYEVETKNLNRSVNRNIQRFPEDFMFKLTKEEYSNLRFQFGTSSWGGRRYLPLAFTEQGVAMLSSVLNSERAILVNVQIIRNFTKLRELILTNENLRQKIETMEKKYDKQFSIVFEAIKQLIAGDEEKKDKKKIGYKID